MMLHIRFLSVCLLISACSDYREVVVRNDAFNIPKSNISQVSEDIDKRLDEGYDISSMVFVVNWTPEEMSKVFPKYFMRRGIHNFHVNVALYAPPDDNLNYVLSGIAHKDKFLLNGKYEGARVEYDEKTRTYNVYDPTRNNKAWTVLRKKPGRLEFLPKTREEFLVGDCTNLGEIKCRTILPYRTYYLDVSISGPNMHLRGQIKGFIISELEKWRIGS